MSDKPRDTQFLGFAKLLLAEVIFAADGVVISDSPHWPEEQLIIAQRAYDLVAHVCKIHCDHEVMKHACSTGKETIIPPFDYMLAKIPDLTVWPDDHE